MCKLSFSDWMNFFTAIGTLVGAGLAIWQISNLIKQQAEQSRNEIEEARREIYQRLELASIDLFRFEADHFELIRPLWEASATLPNPDTAEEKSFHNYVCQILNLHEMAIRFRQGDVMHADVFASWIAWFWELCEAPRFRQIWDDLKEHYIPALQETYNKGLILVPSDGEEESKYTKFRKWLEQQLQDGTLGKPRGEENV